MQTRRINYAIIFLGLIFWLVIGLDKFFHKEKNETFLSGFRWFRFALLFELGRMIAFWEGDALYVVRERRYAYICVTTIRITLLKNNHTNFVVAPVFSQLYMASLKRLEQDLRTQLSRAKIAPSLGQQAMDFLTPTMTNTAAVEHLMSFMLRK